jgi:hypothetical protein
MAIGRFLTPDIFPVLRESRPVTWLSTAAAVTRSDEPICIRTPRTITAFDAFIERYQVFSDGLKVVAKPADPRQTVPEIMEQSCVT